MNSTGGTMVPRRASTPIGKAMVFMGMSFGFQARAGLGPIVFESTMYNNPLPSQTGRVA
jgi:hypothetical protein